jgi:hypothetical protein
VPRPDFRKLRYRLLRSGVAPRHVKRTELELGEHFDDLVDNGMAAGMNRRDAEREAMLTLGDFDLIAAEIGSRPELRSWAVNYPRLALVFYPMACVAVLPAVPIIAGVANASRVGRWIACALMSGLVTAAILLGLQLSITLT